MDRITIARGVEVDLQTTPKVGILSKDDLMKLLKTGEVMVFDKKTGQPLSTLYGISLPTSGEAVLSTIGIRPFSSLKGGRGGEEEQV
jgi:hypothetical protein